MLTDRFSAALATAHTLHAGQVKKGGDVPYIAHLLGVTSIALHHGADEDEAIAALLHDAIEDAPETLGADAVRRLIFWKFGPRVLDIVQGCTDTDERPKPPWLARKRAYVAHVPSLPPSTVLVSASDKVHNVSAILSDFRVVGHDVWQRFNPAAGMPGVIGYYRGLVTAYRTTGHHQRLVDELERVVSALEEAAGHRGVWPPPS
ncbi:MAG: HD domain-containing protein [Vicinamibacterales bacterium]